MRVPEVHAVVCLLECDLLIFAPISARRFLVEAAPIQEDAKLRGEVERQVAGRSFTEAEIGKELQRLALLV